MLDDTPSTTGARERRIFLPPVVPTLITLGNLWCGFLAIAKTADAMVMPAGEGRLYALYWAGWLIFLGMVFDALDGSVARLSGTMSDLGAQLDSLADVVTFGVAPGLLAKAIAEGVGGMEDRRLTLVFGVFFAIMAALRLARYNVEHEDPEEANLWFQGLPTPGAAGVIAGLALILPDTTLRPDGALLKFLPWAALGLGLAMVSRLPYVHFTNRFLKGRKPFHYLVVALTLLALSQAFHFELVLFGVLVLYALSGPVVALLRKFRGGDDDAAVKLSRDGVGVDA